METIGIICEYNPFHNGHIYHIQKCRELYKDALIVLVLNGYFLERGEISVLSKESKAKIALDNGIDLVIALPFFFGSQSADNFAKGAISILDLFGVQKIVFGSESNNIPYLKSIYESNKVFAKQLEIKESLNKGNSYPKAMSVLNENPISSPNDLLGLAYIKAIEELNASITPISIKRTNSYHGKLSTNKIMGAEGIRTKLFKHQSIAKYVPRGVSKNIERLSLDNYFSFLKYKINTEDNLDKYLTVDEGIENMLTKYINEVNSTTELIEKIKSKRYTYNRLQRMLVHILVGLTKDDVKKYKKLDYVQIIGFNNSGTKYLKSLKNWDEIKLMMKNYNSVIYKYEIKATKVYDLISRKENLKFEQSNRPIKY